MRIPQVRKLLENQLKKLNIELALHDGFSANGDRAISPFNKKIEAASQIPEIEQRAATVRSLQQQAADVEHALEKISQGTYGRCDNCGKAIAEARLKALPQASLCLNCKASRPRALLGAYAR